MRAGSYSRVWACLLPQAILSPIRRLQGMTGRVLGGLCFPRAWLQTISALRIWWLYRVQGRVCKKQALLGAHHTNSLIITDLLKSPFCDLKVENLNEVTSYERCFAMNTVWTQNSCNGTVPPVLVLIETKKSSNLDISLLWLWARSRSKPCFWPCKFFTCCHHNLTGKHEKMNASGKASSRKSVEFTGSGSLGRLSAEQPPIPEISLAPLPQAVGHRSTGCYGTTGI